MAKQVLYTANHIDLLIFEFTNKLTSDLVAYNETVIIKCVYWFKVLHVHLTRDVTKRTIFLIISWGSGIV